MDILPTTYASQALFDSIEDLAGDLAVEVGMIADNLRQAHFKASADSPLTQALDGADTAIEQAERLQTLLVELRRRWETH